MKVAAVTMAYNEPDYLPIWARHYARQVGGRHCYVIDHGSDDGSTDNFGEVNVARIPRSPQDDGRRTRFMSRFAASLLDWYDWVIHTDVDEIVLADPRFHPTLVDYCAGGPPEVVTAVGFNLHHLPESEPAIDLGRPIKEQRSWVRFTGAMCKPVLIRRAVDWVPGFHCASDAPVVFDQLFLFHLRWSDRDLGLKRLAKTRAMAWADPAAGAWQRVDDTEFISLFDLFARLPRREGVGFDIGIPPLKDAVQGFLATQKGREHERYKIDLDFNVDELWPLPPRFRGTF
jgi:hypothetical protein